VPRTEQRVCSLSIDGEYEQRGCREAMKSSSWVRSAWLEVVITLQNITMNGTKGERRTALLLVAYLLDLVLGIG
jgi:hypothetical protein